MPILGATLDHYLPTAMYIVAIAILIMNSLKLSEIKNVRDSLMQVLKEAKNVVELKKINAITSSVYYNYFAVVLILSAMVFRYWTFAAFVLDIKTNLGGCFTLSKILAEDYGL